jgi:hypothetical protein
MGVVAILAIIAFLLDLALDVASFVCVDPADWIQPQWLAYVLFYGLLGAVLLGANVVEARRQKRAKLEGVVLPEENPLWFKPILWAFVAYALLSVFMMLFVDRYKGAPIQLSPGSYVADSGHGRPPIPISAEEYHHMRRLSLRRSTGFVLMVYFAVAMDLLFTLAGKKRFKSAMQIGRFSFVLIRNGKGNIQN